MRIRMKKGKTAAKLLLTTTAVLSAQSLWAETKMLEQPAISERHIAFVYAGDIWLANKDGQQAKRLTASSASESAPHFSPDGQWLAYSANHDNNRDVYLISIKGGQPKRLTWHPSADTVNGWSPDGKNILFTSRREMKNGRSAQAWQVAAKGSFPSKVMQAVVQSAAWSPDGKQLAYQPYSTAHRGASGWRNHRGGSTPPIWILKPNGDSYTEIPHVRASDTNPLWFNKDVYFLSDRSGVRNLYKYVLDTKQLNKVTNEALWDISSADGHGNEVIYAAGGELKVLDLTNGQSNKLTIDISPDLAELKVQWKNAMPGLEAATLSATGKRALLSARGEIFTVPLDKGSVRNLTKTSGVRERDGLWSPDGQQIAFTSDEGGEQKLVVSEQDGSNKSRYYRLGKPADYNLLLWAGEGKKILYSDNHLVLWSIDLSSGKKTKIDTDLRRNGRQLSLTKDGRWLAYTKSRANYFTDIYLYDFAKNESHVVTDGMSDATNPAFSPDGQYLYFTASTNTGPVSVGLDMSTQERPVRNGIYALVLAKDGKSPLLPSSDEEEAKKEAEEETKGAKEKPEAKISKIDLAAISERIVALPVAQKAYSNLAVAHDGNLYYVESDQPGASIEAAGNASASSRLIGFNLKERKAKKLADDVTGFALSADGKTLLMNSRAGVLKTASVAAEVGDIKAKPLKTADVKAKIDPSAEWEQIFDEVWRTERDYFYAENMHGLDWQAVHTRYKKLLPHVGRRADLNKLMVEMIAELQVGHNRVFGGDLVTEKPVPVGLLGADLRVKNNQYIVNKIYTGELWNPALKAPLAAPGLGINVGDAIVAVNGTPVTAEVNFYSLFENTVGKQVTLDVAVKANRKNIKQIIVEPIANERGLRFWNWLENNRKEVAKASDGKVGYVYLPDTAGGGFTFFNRMFFAQSDKKAMVIDERQNGGGQAANYITDILSRQYLASWKDRDGLLFDTPGGAVYGPKVMLIDQDAGSGGDFLPYSFKRMGIGKLIGKTTWGGLIGISANRSTIDGGAVVVPFFRFFTPDGEWRVENEGVSPDMEVELNPVLVNQGRDTQLEAAIDEVLKQLATYKPVKLDKAPALPQELGK